MSPLRAAFKQLSHQTQGGITQPAQAKRAKKKSEGCTSWLVRCPVCSPNTHVLARDISSPTADHCRANTSAICACSDDRPPISK